METIKQAPADSPPSSAPSSPSKAEADAEKQRNSQKIQALAAATAAAAASPCKGEDYRKLFHLPVEEVLIQDFNCAFQKKILLQGHMYLFEQYICFYSNIFGYEKKKVLPLRDVAFVRKGWTAGLFPNAIEIGAWGKKYFFASFLSRDEAYRIIVNGWSRHSFHARADPSLGISQMPSISSEITALQGELKPSTKTSELLELNPSTSVEDGEEKRVLPKPARSGQLENSSKSSPFWNIEDAAAPSISTEFKTVMESEFPVDVEDFFELFFSDNAMGFLEDFHKRCGDEAFKCTQWASHPRFGFVRDISFRHPVNLYFGPKSAMCNETQKVRVYRNSQLVIETSQQMSDIPYADYFHVEVRWDVERVAKDVSFHSSVRISMNVAFSKRTLWRGKIEQATLDECKETYSIWVREAFNVLSSKVNLISANDAADGSAASSSHSGQDAANQSCDSKVTRSENNKCGMLFDLDAVARGIRKCQRAVVDCFARNPMVSLLFTIALLAVVMQCATLAAVSRKPALATTFPQAFQASRCLGGSSEAIAWLEQRARLVKEEMALTESRLHSLNQDFAMLKLHMHLFDGIKSDRP